MINETDYVWYKQSTGFNDRQVQQRSVNVITSSSCPQPVPNQAKLEKDRNKQTIYITSLGRPNHGIPFRFVRNINIRHKTQILNVIVTYSL